jgi:uncharacterized DUF497 family protein
MDIPSRLGINEDDFRVVIGSSKIDYDPDKEEVNRRKHKYSLESAVYLLQKWLLPVCSTPFFTSDPFYKNDETRHQHMGVDDEGNVVFMVTTMRPDETVRIISFRRASEEEKEVFYTKLQSISDNTL